MGQPHKYAELIKAWADGAEVQYRMVDYREGSQLCFSEWKDTARPAWNIHPDVEYRLKPQKKVGYVNVYPNMALAGDTYPTRHEADRNAFLRRIARIRFEYIEGQFDE